MKRVLAGLLLGSALFSGLAGAGYAEERTPSQTYPYVADRRPFSYEANYMSLPGFLRFIVYQRDGIWLDRRQVSAIVHQQIATGE